MVSNGGLVHLFWMNLRPINSYAEEPQCVALDDVEVRCRFLLGT